MLKKKSIKRALCLFNAIILTIFLLFPYSIENTLTTYAVPIERANENDVFLKQAEWDSCTFCAATMLIRRVALLRGDNSWNSITEGAVTNVSWCDDGLLNNFSYGDIHMKCYTERAVDKHPKIW